MDEGKKERERAKWIEWGNILGEKKKMCKKNYKCSACYQEGNIRSIPSALGWQFLLCGFLLYPSERIRVFTVLLLSMFAFLEKERCVDGRTKEKGRSRNR